MPQEGLPLTGWLDGLRRAQALMMDGIRCRQAKAYDWFGLGPNEHPYEIVASGPFWRLRRYSGDQDGAPVLIVPSPIKRPYIWDLTPSLSAVRSCLDAGYDVHLIEWLPPEEGQGDIGMAEFARAISACALAARGGRTEAPIVLGHSLGGTLAAIACAAAPDAARSLVLLASPLCFEPASTSFRDILVSLVPPDWEEDDIVAGSSLSNLSAAVLPTTFVWSRWMDAARSASDPPAFETHARISRWALDEVAVPGVLITQIIQNLYRDDRFHAGTLSVGGRRLGPRDLRVPLLCVVSTGDEITPRASVEAFMEAMEPGTLGIIEHEPETGVALQHLAILAGPQAHDEVWPKIFAWLRQVP